MAAIIAFATSEFWTRNLSPLASVGAISGLFAEKYFIPLIQYLIETQGWWGALLVMGAVNVVVCGGLYALAIDARKRPGETRLSSRRGQLGEKNSVAPIGIRNGRSFGRSGVGMYAST